MDIFHDRNLIPVNVKFERVIDRWTQVLHGDREAIQAVMNHVHPWRLLGRDSVEASADEEQAFAELLAACWRARLHLRYPDRDFVVTVSGTDEEEDDETDGVEVTFYERTERQQEGRLACKPVSPWSSRSSRIQRGWLFPESSFRFGGDRTPRVYRGKQGLKLTVRKEDVVLEQRVLDQSALVYMRDQLASGRQLSSQLLQGLDLTAGTLWTYVPTGVYPSSRDIVDDLQDGMRRSQEVRIHGAEADEGVDPAQDVIGEFLSRHVGSYCIAEDAGANPDDPFIVQSTEPHYFFVDDDVYVYLASKDAHGSDVARTVELATSYRLTAILTLWPGADDLIHPRVKVSVNVLKQLVEATQILIISAYDGAGYAFWGRRGEE